MNAFKRPILNADTYHPIWDIAAPGYFLTPDAFLAESTPTPRLLDSSLWQRDEQRTKWWSSAISAAILSSLACLTCCSMLRSKVRPAEKTEAGDVPQLFRKKER